jgi:Zn-finger domain-containing protein
MSKNDDLGLDEYIEIELSERYLDEYSEKIENTINEIIKLNNFDDSRLELLTVLISFSVKLSLDLNIYEEDFLGLIKDTLDMAKEDIESEINAVTPGTKILN